MSRSLPGASAVPLVTCPTTFSTNNPACLHQLCVFQLSIHRRSQVTQQACAIRRSRCGNEKALYCVCGGQVRPKNIRKFRRGENRKALRTPTKNNDPPLSILPSGQSSTITTVGPSYPLPFPPLIPLTAPQPFQYPCPTSSEK